MHTDVFPDSAQFPSTQGSSHDLDPEEMDIHGKLVALNAVDLSNLTLSNRCAMILLAGPWVTDDFGRFTGPPGFIPDLAPLSKKQASLAIRALIEKGLIKTWTHEGSHCWEVAGAYAFKSNLKAKMGERARLSRLKRVMQDERKMRRSEEFQGDSYLHEDDGAPNSNNVVETIRTTRGGHVPMNPTVFFRRKVPVPKGTGKYKLIIPQPKDESGCVKHLYPSFNVYAGLSPLGVVIRHLLIWKADDYGRVRIDIERLHGEMGPAITKRVTKEDIEREIGRMSNSGHLLIFRRSSGTYAYVRDAAQHMKEWKMKNMELPRLVDDREFTHDSDAYKAFFAAWRAHTITRDKVHIASYSKDGVLYSVNEYVEVAAKRFLEEYARDINLDRYKDATSETIHAIYRAAPDCERLYGIQLFFYGYLNRMSHRWMESFYELCSDAVADSSSNNFKIFRYLMGMSPHEYLEQLRDKTIDEIAPMPKLRYLNDMTAQEYVQALLDKANRAGTPRSGDA